MSVQVAVVGMGYWGKNLVRNFHQLNALYSVCDSNPEVKNILSENYPATKYCSNYEDLLNDVSVDAVAIATPAVTHYEMTKRAIEAGKDVFVEKPLAIDVEQGQVLVNLAEKMKKILLVGHILHYHPAVIKLKQLFSDGALGNVQYLYSNRLNMGKIRTEENILWSFAPHDISVMLGLLKEDPLEVTSKGGAYLSRDVVDVTLSEFLFPSGIRAHIFVSWLHPFKEQLLVVVGSEKMAVFDDTSQDKLKLYPHKVEWKNQVPVAIKAKAEIIELEQAEPLKSECQHFIDCVSNRTQPLTDGQEGLRVLKILDRCQKSLDL